MRVPSFVRSRVQETAYSELSSALNEEFKESDPAMVGWLVDSCRACSACREGQEPFCEVPAIFPGNSAAKRVGGVI